MVSRAQPHGRNALVYGRTDTIDGTHQTDWAIRRINTVDATRRTGRNDATRQTGRNDATRQTDRNDVLRRSEVYHLTGKFLIHSPFKVLKHLQHQDPPIHPSTMSIGQITCLYQADSPEN